MLISYKININRDKITRLWVSFLDLASLNNNIIVELINFISYYSVLLPSEKGYGLRNQIKSFGIAENVSRLYYSIVKKAQSFYKALFSICLFF